MRSLEDYDSKYQTDDYDRYYSRGYQYTSSKKDAISFEDSQEQLFNSSSRDIKHSQIMQSSPDNNLTYSSYEASLAN